MNKIRFIGLPPDKGREDYFSDGLISIRLQGRCNNSASLMKSDTIQSLQQYSTIQNCRFVFNGTILNPNLTLSFYGISDNDTIFVIGPDPTPKKVSVGMQVFPDITQQLQDHFNKHWAHRHSDPDEAFQRFKAAVDPATAQESARLNDITRNRIESTTSGFRKICNKWKDSTQGTQTRVQIPRPPSSTPQAHNSLNKVTE